MIVASDPVLPKPLAVASGTPVVYTALGAVMHLECLEPDDEGRLAAVNDLVWDWFGDRLRWMERSFDPQVQRAQRAESDYIAGYPTMLDVPRTSEPLDQAILSAQASVVRDDFEVAFCGGETAGSASPYSYRFWAETVGASAGGTRAHAVLHITVPESWPIDDFRERITAIAASLRLRWASAGYTYSPWLVSGFEVAGTKMAAHARRHVGYDIAEYVRLVQPFHECIRTVNWLTFLGKDMVAKLREKGPLESSQQLAIQPVGDSLLVRAGDVPERGDLNRLQYPTAYLEADILLRPVRARDGRDMVFFGPWDEDQITDWLCRFERAVN